MDVRCCTPLSRARVGWASIYMGSGPTPLHGRGRGSDLRQPACSVGWWLMAGAGLFWENSTAGWLLVAGLFWEKSTAGWWLISQANRAVEKHYTPVNSRYSRETKLMTYWHYHPFTLEKFLESMKIMRVVYQRNLTRVLRSTTRSKIIIRNYYDTLLIICKSTDFFK
jgi:hypothetical protein